MRTVRANKILTSNTDGGEDQCRISKVLRSVFSLSKRRPFRTKCSRHSSRPYYAALEAGDTALAQQTYKAAVKKIDQAAARGIIHKNAAARKKSQFTKALNNM